MSAPIETLLFEVAAKQLSEAVIITDAFGRITWSNPAFYRLSGYSSDECLQQSLCNLLQGPKTPPETIAAIHHTIELGLYLRTEILSYHKERHPYWSFLSFAPIKDAHDNCQGFIVIEHDTTNEHLQFENMEEQIVQVYGALLHSERDAHRHHATADHRPHRSLHRQRFMSHN